MTAMTGEELKTVFIEQLDSAMQAGDIVAVETALNSIIEQIGHSPEYMKWVTEPVNITKLHQDLIDKYGVPPRAMMLRHRVTNRHQRAVMFLKAMLNGVKRIQKSPPAPSM